ncbi:glycosyl transferase [Bombiscardovia apis]|uniref:Glycosyl transferase n=1 Tax=Bombiscardovia apis TaxID=2932182 RepID=A0ABN6SHQ4_9BIFI|nr:glycosyltransferase family 2 protein [Bombiscardovia apis]BDR54115.1 glycosyl transferase [Bombiscardovia apis]
MTFQASSNQALVSIIVPVYNAELYLEACLRSILNQSHSQLEIIAVDDGSTDHSGSICDRMAQEDDRLRVIHQSNGGIGKAQNRGLDEARGEYIAFVDNDDILDRHNIEFLLKAIQNSGADMSKARWTQFGASQHASIAELAEVGAPAPRSITLLVQPFQAYQNVFCKSLRKLADLRSKKGEAQYFNEANWCRLYKRKVWKDIRFPEGVYAQDVMIAGQLYERMLWVADIDLPLYYWLQTPGSVTHSNKEPSFYHDNIAAGIANFKLALEHDVRPARSTYTMLDGLRSLRTVSRQTGRDQDLYQSDRRAVRQLLRQLDPATLLSCLGLSILRSAEKRVYDLKIKNMA